MKYLLILAAMVMVSCTKEEMEPAPTAEEEIQVMVYATPIGDSTIIASTPVVRLRIK
jgi:hypothetical protein